MTAPLPPRPPRRMPGRWAIVSHWLPRGIFDLDLGIPHCFGCLMDGQCDEDIPISARWQAARWLQRAHLADRVFRGLDGPQNMCLLCWKCHGSMPSFRDGTEAIRWVQGRSPAISDAELTRPLNLGWLLPARAGWPLAS